MASDHASHAAAVTAGYKSIVTDRGAAWPPATRYEVTLEKHLSGGPNSTSFPVRAVGEGSSQAAAEAAAVAALNGQRAVRYGRGATNNTGSRGGGALTADAD